MATTTKSPAEIARDTIQTLFATHDLTVLDPHPGMESLKKVFPAFVTGLPDIKVELQQQVVEGSGCHRIGSSPQHIIANCMEYRRQAKKYASKTSIS